MLLASTLTPRCYTAEEEGLCYKNLLFSSDHGDTWRLLQEYVVQFDWVRHMKTHGHEYPEDAIFATVHAEEHRGRGHQTFGKWDNRVDFVLTRDLFLSHTVLVPRGNRFLFTERYVAVAAVGDHDKHVNLVLSSDGGRRWHAAELEYPMTQHSYTILDTSNDAVFLHVNHAGEGARWGNVYLSNSIGTNFSLSLPHNRRDENGKCDFEKLQSMEGVYIANYYENVGELTAYEHAASEAMGQSIAGKTDGLDLADASGLTPPDPQIRTVMTFDRGASWEYLPAPKYDALAQAVECHSGDHPMDGFGARHCSLHLHGVTDVFGPFYSSPNAVGLMMVSCALCVLNSKGADWRRMAVLLRWQGACREKLPRMQSRPRIIAARAQPVLLNLAHPLPLPFPLYVPAGHGQHRLRAHLPRGPGQHVLLPGRRPRVVRGSKRLPHLRVRRPRRHHRHGQRRGGGDGGHVQLERGPDLGGPQVRQ